MTSSPTAEDLQPWARKAVVYGGSVYAGLSIVSSSVALTLLAVDAGYRDPRALLFGVGFDVAAAVTGSAWAGSRIGSWWHHIGRRATIGLFSASLVFNAAEVLEVRGILPPVLLLVVAVAVSLVFPALALVFGHLVLMARRTADPAPDPAPRARRPAPKTPAPTTAIPAPPTAERPADPAPTTAPVPAVTPAPTTAPVPAVTPAPKRRRTAADGDEDAQILRGLAEQWRAANPSGGPDALRTYLAGQGRTTTDHRARVLLGLR